MIAIVRIFVALILLGSVSVADDTSLEDALKRAGSNRSELEQAIEKAPAEEKEGMIFLLKTCRIVICKV